MIGGGKNKLILKRQLSTVILSRQYKQDLLKNNKQWIKPIPKPAAPPKEQPWPRAFQIAGYTILVATIPTSIATLIIEQRSLQLLLKEKCSPYGENIVNWLRENFAPNVKYSVHVRPDNDAYVDITEERYFDHSHDIPTTRQNQEHIDEILQENYRVIFKDENDIESCAELNGNILVNSNLMQNNQSLIFVDSSDYSEQEEDISETLSSTEEEQELHQIASVYSTWTFIPSTKVNQQTNTALLSEKEYQISKLSHRKQEITNMLKDVNCTANVDDLVQELNLISRELHRLNHAWIRWGLSFIF